MRQYNWEKRTYKAIFIDKYQDKGQVGHYAFPEANEDKNIIPYQTSYDKAKKNFFYNKEPLIKKFDGIIKESTLIPYKYDNLKQISLEKKVPIIKQIKGAYENGYNIKEISTDYKLAIKDFVKFEIEIESILIEQNIYDKEIKDEIIKAMINFISKMDIEETKYLE